MYVLVKEANGTYYYSTAFDSMGINMNWREFYLT